MSNVPPKSVGLGGDGDEIFAIEEVERAFGATLDKGDAEHWLTAGDLFLSLCKAFPAEVRDDSDTWVRFTEALAKATGVDPTALERDSPLLEHSLFWVQIANASAAI
jgi:hypothetical protein